MRNEDFSPSGEKSEDFSPSGEKDRSGKPGKNQLKELARIREQIGVERYREIVLLLFNSPAECNTKTKARRLLHEMNKEILRRQEEEDAKFRSPLVEEMERFLHRFRSELGRCGLPPRGRKQSLDPELLIFPYPTPAVEP